MPGSTLPPSQAGALGGPNGLIARVERLERNIRPPDHGRTTGEMIFSYAGELSPGVESPPWYPGKSGSIRQVRVSVLGGVVVDHVIEVRVDGFAIQQFTLASGDLTMSEATAIDLTPISYVTVKTITVSGANLSVQMLAG